MNILIKYNKIHKYESIWRNSKIINKKDYDHNNNPFPFPKKGKKKKLMRNLFLDFLNFKIY